MRETQSVGGSTIMIREMMLAFGEEQIHISESVKLMQTFLNSDKISECHILCNHPRQ